MKAIAFYEHGGPEVLRFIDLPDPEPSPGEVLVRVKAVGINHLDLWVRKGLPHLKIKYPHIPGSDIAGVVEKLGEGVDGPPVGTKVILQPAKSCGVCHACLGGRDNFCRQYAILGENTSGGYCELIAVPRSSILPYPEGLTFEEAACIPLNFQTAWQMVVRRADVKPGEFVLLNGAGSGVTIAALQIVKLMGGVTILSSTSDEKLDKVKGLGADYLINSRRESLSSQVKKITNGRGADVVIDHIGKGLWEENLKAIAWGGRLVICGATSGADVGIDLRHVFFKQLSILGSTMGSRADLWEVLKHVNNGKLKPVIDSVFPLSEARNAHQRLEKGLQTGKIILVP